jgi:hypothetical protein
MKTRGFIIIVFALALTLPAQFVNSSEAAPAYSARLISPTAGQVLHPGQIVRVQWKSVFPAVNLEYCEAEVWMSLDGGITYPVLVTWSMDPKAQYLYWTVPNLPTNEAVMDIRFGCEYPDFYPETLSPQKRSRFVIAASPIEN